MVMATMVSTFATSWTDLSTLPGNSATLKAGQNYRATSSATYSSGLTVEKGDPVVLCINSGVTVSASGSYGAPGITLEEGATLIVIGEGTLTAVGANAARGGWGARGDDAWCHRDKDYFYAGSGGNGGSGGRGGAPAIGGQGGAGGAGGTGGWRPYHEDLDDHDEWGGNGDVGGNGSSGTGMGRLFLMGHVTLNLTKGTASDSPETGGSCTSKDCNDWGLFWYAAGSGGGGGAGGNGYPADFLIGGGGAGAGGGGGGHGGGVHRRGWPWRGETEWRHGRGGSGGQGYVNGQNGETTGSEQGRCAEKVRFRPDNTGAAGGSKGTNGGNGAVFASALYSSSATGRGDSHAISDAISFSTEHKDEPKLLEKVIRKVTFGSDPNIEVQPDIEFYCYMQWTTLSVKPGKSLKVQDSQFVGYSDANGNLVFDENGNLVETNNPYFTKVNDKWYIRECDDLVLYPLIADHRSVRVLHLFGNPNVPADSEQEFYPIFDQVVEEFSVYVADWTDEPVNVTVYAEGSEWDAENYKFNKKSHFDALDNTFVCDPEDKRTVTFALSKNFDGKEPVATFHHRYDECNVHWWEDLSGYPLSRENSSSIINGAGNYTEKQMMRIHQTIVPPMFAGDKGYDFAYWMVNTERVDNLPVYVEPGTTHSFTAHFEKKNLTLTASVRADHFNQKHGEFKVHKNDTYEPLEQTVVPFDDEFTFQMLPDNGYELALNGLRFYGDNGEGRTDVTEQLNVQKNGNEYTFHMPKYNVAIEATLQASEYHLRPTDITEQGGKAEGNTAALLISIRSAVDGHTVCYTNDKSVFSADTIRNLADDGATYHVGDEIRVRVSPYNTTGTSYVPTKIEKAAGGHQGSDFSFRKDIDPLTYDVEYVFGNTCVVDMQLKITYDTRAAHKVTYTLDPNQPYQLAYVYRNGVEQNLNEPIIAAAEDYVVFKFTPTSSEVPEMPDTLMTATYTHPQFLRKTAVFVYDITVGERPFTQRAFTFVMPDADTNVELGEIDGQLPLRVQPVPLFDYYIDVPAFVRDGVAVPFICTSNANALNPEDVKVSVLNRNNYPEVSAGYNAEQGIGSFVASASAAPYYILLSNEDPVQTSVELPMQMDDIYYGGFVGDETRVTIVPDNAQAYCATAIEKVDDYYQLRMQKVSYIKLIPAKTPTILVSAEREPNLLQLAAGGQWTEDENLLCAYKDGSHPQKFLTMNAITDGIVFSSANNGDVRDGDVILPVASDWDDNVAVYIVKKGSTPTDTDELIMEIHRPAADGTYTIHGMRVDPRGPLPTGLYIVNGKKIFVQ